MKVHTLVLSISALNLLMLILLYLAFQNASSCGFVKAGGLEDMCCVDPVVDTSAHYMLFEIYSELVLIDRYLLDCVTVRQRFSHNLGGYVSCRNSGICRKKQMRDPDHKPTREQQGKRGERIAPWRDE